MAVLDTRTIQCLQIALAVGPAADQFLSVFNPAAAGTSEASKVVVAGSDGGVAFVGRLTTTDGVSSGTAKVIGGLAYSNTAASSAVASTSAETQFDTFYTMPANTLKAGTVVKIRFQGIATTTIGSDTVGVKLYLGGIGGTALITAAAVDAADAMTFTGECTLICRTAGATGTFVSVGIYKTIAAEGTFTAKDDIVASTTINTTTSQIISAAATWNNTNANSCRLDILTVEIY